MWIGGITGAVFAPVECQMLWEFPRPVWFVGKWTEAGLRTAVSATSCCRLAVAGDCYATTAELNSGLDEVASGNWRALTWWPGSYWVVCDDGRETTVLTDVAGTRPVYFTQFEGGTAWATQACPLADLTGSGPDSQALSAWMTCPTVPEASPGGTMFTQVRRLPGGCALHLSGNSRVTRYEPEDSLQPFADAADALRDALVTAVSVRAAQTDRLSSDFSGGLDSATLVLLATRAGYPILAITHADPDVVNDDISYATRLAMGEDLITHVVAPSSRRFFDCLEATPPTDQPLSDAARWAVHAGFRQPVREYGSDAHLTGSGGDTLLSAGPQALACLASVSQGKSTDFLRHAASRARLRQLPVHALVRSALALSRTSYEQALDRLASEIRHPAAGSHSRATMSWCGHGVTTPWLTTDARRQLAAVLSTASVPRGGSVPPWRRVAWNEVHEFGAYQAELTAQAGAGGVPIHAPMFDNAVVRAAMSIPLYQRLSVTVQKPLLNAAFSRVLPPLLLHRRTKGAYDGSGYAGIRANAAQLTAMAARSRLAEVGIIDPQAVREEIAKLAAGVPGRMAGVEAFIAAELWLDWQTWRPRIRWWKGAPAHA